MSAQDGHTHTFAQAVIVEAQTEPTTRPVHGLCLTCQALVDVNAWIRA